MVHAHQAAADDLSRIGAGVDTQRQRTDHHKIPAGSEDNQAHDHQLHHHRRTADHGHIDLQQAVDEPENGVFVSGTLLVMCRTDHRDNDTEDHAQHQCQHRHVQRGHHAVQVLQPAVIFDECLIKKDIELLPQCGRFIRSHHCLPGHKLFHGNGSSPSLVDRAVLR